LTDIKAPILAASNLGLPISCADVREKLLALIFDEEPTTPRRNLRDVA